MRRVNAGHVDEGESDNTDRDKDKVLKITSQDKVQHYNLLTLL